MYYYDTETCGLHGPVCLLQYADGLEGEINLHSTWNEPIADTMLIIEELMDKGTCGFNLAFDQFHLSQFYNVIKIHSNHQQPPDIEEYASLERQARDGVSLKPRHALDLMLHARKGPYQSTMNRKDIKIKKVPTVLANGIAGELNRRIPLPDIYFERQVDKSIRWQVVDVFNDLGDLVPEFKNLVLRFKPSSALKALCIDIGLVNRKERLLMKDVGLAESLSPVDIGYAPFADAVRLRALNDMTEQEITYESKLFKQSKKWYGAWPHVIRHHISHWSYNQMAREYAYDDVRDTRNLHKFFSAQISGLTKKASLDFALDLSDTTIDSYLEYDDDDSVLACAVGNIRWKGFNVDIDGLRDLKARAEKSLIGLPFNPNSSPSCRAYLFEKMNETEKINTAGSTRGILLEEMSRWKEASVCKECKGMGCDICDDGLIDSTVEHPVAERAQAILDSRHAGKEINLYEKLILADRFHASFIIIGTKSSRMAGSDGLNAQGINHAEFVRKCFPFAFEGEDLEGGDYDGFEMSIMDAAYHDSRLRAELISGRKIHAMWGERYFFPNLTYDQILATAKLAGDKNKYLRSKNGVFAYCYFGEGYTFNTRVGIPMEIAEEAYQKIMEDYPELTEKRKEIVSKFCSMTQPGGVGSKVIWADPDEYVESMLGFRRFFTLENKIVKVLFELAEDPPKEWMKYSGKVKRRERVQTITGSIRTALFAAAFGLQGNNMRAAGNHKIQSTAGTITKHLQRRIWDLQPIGVSPWIVRPMNVHDEVMAVTTIDLKETVDKVNKEYSELIPLISMNWTKLKNWSEKL